MLGRDKADQHRLAKGVFCLHSPEPWRKSRSASDVLKSYGIVSGHKRAMTAFRERYTLHK
jgi:hypothetical protein